MPDGAVTDTAGNPVLSFSDNFLVEVNSPAGTPDPTFGQGGLATIPVPGGDFEFIPSAVAPESDGKLVVAGTLATSSVVYTEAGTAVTTEFAVAQLNADGSLDTAFGQDGLATADFPYATDAESFLAYNTSSEPIAGLPQADVTSVVIQPDGKIIVAGYIGYPVGESNLAGDPSFVPTFSSAIALARFNADGSLDTSFGNGTGQPYNGNGVVIAKQVPDTWIPDPSGNLANNFIQQGSTDNATGVALQTDGSIVVVGSTYLNSLFTGNIPEPNPLVARFNADGTLDTTFGSGGFVNPQNFTPQSVAIEGASIILGGTYYPPNGGSEFALAELNANGTPDTTFGNGTGWVTTDVGASQSSTINAIAIQPDGEIVAAGSVNLYNPLEPSAFALARYNPDGSLDTSFGDADPANPGSEIGWTTTEFSGLTDGADQAFCVALESDGEIVLAGGTLNADGSASAAVAIYNTDGSLDTMFASGHDTEGGLYDSAAGVVVQPDGKIVTVSTSRDSGTVQAIRYEGSLQNVVAGEQQQSASPPPVVLQATTGPQVARTSGR